MIATALKSSMIYLSVNYRIDNIHFLNVPFTPSWNHEDVACSEEICIIWSSSLGANAAMKNLYEKMSIMAE